MNSIHELINNLSQSLCESKQTDIVKIILLSLRDYFKADIVSFISIDGFNNGLICHIAFDHNNNEIDRNQFSFDAHFQEGKGSGLAVKAFAQNKIIIEKNLKKNPDHKEIVEGINSTIIIPIYHVLKLKGRKDHHYARAIIKLDQ